MDGGNNPPYRQHCKSLLAGCQRTAANVIRTGPCNPQNTVPAYHSTTLYNGNAPVTLPASNPCGTGPQADPPYGPYSLPYPAQTFAQAGTVNLGTAKKIGFKNVQAARFWHGRYGFTVHMGQGGQGDTVLPCTDANGGISPTAPIESLSLSPPSTKYCSLSGSASYTRVSVPAGAYPELEFSGSITGRSVVVNPLTGVVTAAGSVATSGGIGPTDMSDLMALADGAVASFYQYFGGFVTDDWSDKDYFTTTYSDGVFTVTWTPSFNGGQVVETLSFANGSIERKLYGNVSLDGGQTYAWGVYSDESMTWSDTEFNYSFVQYDTDYQTNKSVIVTLGAPNSKASLWADLVTLAGQWDLTDDLKYPWRTDNNTGMAPLVTRNEVPGEIAPVTSVSLTPGWVDPNATKYDGSIVGAPYPAGYGYNSDGSFGGIFDFGHENYGPCPGDDSPDFWAVQSYGAWTPNYLPANCPQWTREDIATRFPGAGHLLYNFLLNPEEQRSGLPVVLQKWAEIDETWQSYNCARPAGADRFTFDETTSGGTSLVYQVKSGYAHGTGDTIVLTDNMGNALAPGLPAINSGDIWGGQSVGGFYHITSAGTSQVLLGQKIFNVPTGWNTAPGCNDAATAFGRLRFPSCPGILGRVAVSAVTNASPCHLTLQPSPYLAVNLTAPEYVDICAADMTVLASNVQITRVSDTDFTVPTAYATIAAAMFVVSVTLHDGTTPGTHYYWDDQYPKGDYLILEWGFDYRAFAETARINTLISQCASKSGGPFTTCTEGLDCTALGSTQTVPFSAYNSFIQTAGCMPVNPCAPPVICISPNGEVFPNGITVPFPTILDFDAEYGTRWQAAPMTSMGDPLWQVPHNPPPPDDPITGLPLGNFTWSMDDGSCKSASASPPTSFYPHMPVVEARATLPANGGPAQNETAPALPAGVTIGFTSPVTNADSQTAYAPSPGSATSWTFHDAACGCMGSAGTWAAYYATFVLYC